MNEHNQFHLESGRRIFRHEDSSHDKVTEILKKGQRRLGQVVVEYILLLILAVAISSLAIKGCVKRNEDDAGIVITFWDVILKTIGEDLADEPDQTN